MRHRMCGSLMAPLNRLRIDLREWNGTPFVFFLYCFSVSTIGYIEGEWSYARPLGRRQYSSIVNLTEEEKIKTQTKISDGTFSFALQLIHFIEFIFVVHLSTISVSIILSNSFYNHIRVLSLYLFSFIAIVFVYSDFFWYNHINICVWVW